LAWAQNFPFFLKHNQQMLKVISDIQKAQKELDQKVEKMQNIKNVLTTLENEGYYELLRIQISEDTALIEKYRALHDDTIDRAKKAQQKY
jgi:hypothetical protein